MTTVWFELKKKKKVTDEDGRVRMTDRQTPVKCSPLHLDIHKPRAVNMDPSYVKIQACTNIIVLPSQINRERQFRHLSTMATSI